MNGPGTERMVDARRVLFFGAALIASLLLSACTEQPNTYFDWGVSTSTAKTSTKTTARRKYVYNDQYNDRATPKARPAYTPTATSTQSSASAQPAWYQQSNHDCYCNQPRPQEARTQPADAAGPTPQPNPGAGSSTAAAPQAPPPATTATNANPAPIGDPRFAWPVRGRVIAGFGDGTAGQRNVGINIAAAYDTPIHAAASGTVSYAGDDLKNYGNLVLIKHDGGFITAYAHADRLSVSRGQHVSRGDVIGYAGTSGDVTSPQVHFEIRRGVKPVDPRLFLETKSASR
jgi:murein DD-endopeptidase MepM/ murein hydrolase activator NlpD